MSKIFADKKRIYVSILFTAELTLGFIMKGPDDEIIYHDLPDSSNNHIHTATKEGDYALCFDNNHTSSVTKLVNVEIYVYSNESEDDDRWGYFDDASSLTPDEQYEESVDNLKVISISILKRKKKKINSCFGKCRPNRQT